MISASHVPASPHIQATRTLRRLREEPFSREIFGDTIKLFARDGSFFFLRDWGYHIILRV